MRLLTSPIYISWGAGHTQRLPCDPPCSVCFNVRITSHDLFNTGCAPPPLHLAVFAKACQEGVQLIGLSARACGTDLPAGPPQFSASGMQFISLKLRCDAQCKCMELITDC